MNFDKESISWIFFFCVYVCVWGGGEINKREDNSESIKVRIVILEPDTLSRCVLHNCEVS